MYLRIRQQPEHDEDKNNGQQVMMSDPAGLIYS